ncbi:MAG: cyclic lactone autoinducer peptide [Senegalia sp. (in: firmicutes)]
MKNKKLIKFLLSPLALIAMFVGTNAASSASSFFIHQPKCPDELLK